jgi:hypothetical protein
MEMSKVLQQDSIERNWDKQINMNRLNREPRSRKVGCGTGHWQGQGRDREGQEKAQNNGLDRVGTRTVTAISMKY